MEQRQDSPHRELAEWFLHNRREFPWREDPTPYKVWISEVMLQQTRASVVIPYFERWIDRFPNIESLATASFDTLLKAWEGLGYYQRLRNLYRTAKEICERFGGKIPDHEEALQSLPGLGPYTRGAILSFGFKKRAAAVDGNAMRAVVRYFQIEEDTSKEKVKKKIFAFQEKILPIEKPYLLVEAWIELGATICLPKARCEICPLANSCLALKNHKVTLLPLRSKKKEVTLLRRAVLVVAKQNAFLVHRVSQGEVMADLYEFPYFDFEKREISKQKVASWAFSDLGIRVDKILPLDLQKQSFTSFRATLFPFFALCLRQHKHNPSYGWIPKSQLGLLSFSSGHRRILQEVLEKK